MEWPAGRVLDACFPKQTTVRGAPLLLMAFPAAVMLSNERDGYAMTYPAKLLSSPSVASPIAIVHLPLYTRREITRMRADGGGGAGFFVFSFSLGFWYLVSFKRSYQRGIWQGGMFVSWAVNRPNFFMRRVPSGWRWGPCGL